uniref:transmembrane protein 241 isoform X6 n=1 Tax=Halichoerus grypus TaxID=9711 RepID=UPI0016595152|nr:transmembrane protein 241 isoform X6 [Halichoerus grypus]
MCVRRCLVGLTFCTCYLASYLTNKYVLSVLKFTYPTLFQGWQTLIGGLLLHVSWKLGWAEINSSLRSDVSTWLPASVLFVGIIYAGSRALSKLAIPVFLTLHNVAEVILCGHQKCFRKEKTPPAKTCSALFLLAAAGCLPFNDPQFDPGGYFWAVIHLLCVGAYKILQKAWKPNVLSDIDQQYLNYMFSVVFLALASHPTGHHGWLVSIAVRYDPDQCNSGMPPARWTWRGLAGFLRAEGLLRAGRVDSQVPAGVHRPWTSDLPVECVRGKKAGTVRPPLLTASRRTPSAGLWAAAENGLCCVFLLREAPSGPADRAVPRGADPATGVPPVQGRLCSPGLIRRPPC